ncbi:MAG: hypothetical protein HeimC3_00890 [Candidatus Heimdallarchaeota archaeon LC_3]|nr:MAG: hypothetical protein HeimC3_00890 [Candidatus Heimdallarchaeota archaeon LC_3]
MPEPNRSQQYKSFIVLADIPIFVIVGVVAGYYLFGGNNSENSSLGAMFGGFIFFILSLIPAISLALQEHKADKVAFVKNQESFEKRHEIVKNTLFSKEIQKDEKSP